MMKKGITQKLVMGETIKQNVGCNNHPLNDFKIRNESWRVFNDPQTKTGQNLLTMFSIRKI